MLLFSAENQKHSHQFSLLTFINKEIYIKWSLSMQFIYNIFSDVVEKNQLSIIKGMKTANEYIFPIVYLKWAVNSESTNDPAIHGLRTKERRW